MADMTYSESARGIWIGPERIAKEFRDHGHVPGGAEWVDMCQELFNGRDVIPDDACMLASDVLLALGY